jgi:hypothetical protein
MRPAADQPPTSRRLTVQEAALLLGVTVDAVRGRIKRGTLESAKGEDGTVYVLIEETDQPNGQSQPAADESGLVEHMQDQIDYLRRQLEVWQEEARRKDHIIAALTERIPELEPAKEAPPEGRESPETASEERADTQEPPTDQGQEKRPSWWRRFFGLENPA